MKSWLVLFPSIAFASVFHIQPRHGPNRYILSTFPHTTIGQKGFNTLIEVEVLPVDCVFLKCAPAPSCPGRLLGHGGGCSGRQLERTQMVAGRNLGHGASGAVTAPAGWRPDASAPATDYCDLRTMVGSLGSRQVVGLVEFGGWYTTCCLVPKTFAPFTYAKSAGLIALMMTTVVDPIMAIGHVPYMHGGNPIPDIPFVTTSLRPQNFLPSWSNRSEDTANKVDAQSLLIACCATCNLSANANCGGAVQTMFANISADDDGQNLVSPGATFLYVIVGIGFVVQVLFVFYLEFKRCKQFQPLGHVVLVVEGLMCGGLRAYRQFENPSSGAITEDVSFQGMWFLDAGGSLESSLSVAATFLTITVYVKLILSAMGCRLSTKGGKALDFIMVVIGVLLCGALIFFSILFPFQPWLKDDLEFMNSLTNSELRKLTYEPGFVINTVFAGIFIVASVFALVMLAKVARKGSSSSIFATLKRLLKYILLQIVGLIMVVVATGLRSNYSVAWYYSLPDYGMYWCQLQLQSFGNLLASWGAIMTIACSSSSSSSSSFSSPRP